MKSVRSMIRAPVRMDQATDGRSGCSCRALHGRLQITEGLSGKSDFTISPPPEQTPAGFRLLVRQSLFVDMDAAPGSRMRVVPCSRGKTAA